MSDVRFDGSSDDGDERPFWFRLSSSAVLVGAAIGWASVTVACCLAAPVALALGAGDGRRPSPPDEL